MSDPPFFYEDTQPLTERQRQKLFKMLSRAMMEIRWLAWHDCAQQAGDLADTVHNLPYLLSANAISWSRLQWDLKRYEQQYPRRESRFVEIQMGTNFTEMLAQIID